jgi:tetratricopeptide (TPR) repeat protein
MWALIRLFTSDMLSVYSLYFIDFSACSIWYFCLRTFFGAFNEKGKEKYLILFIIALGYAQVGVCALQLTGIIPSFSPIFPVSGTFNNTSELGIYLTCILPITVSIGLKASDSTPTGKFIRAVCLFYVLCWLVLNLTIGCRTALLSGIIGMVVFVSFRMGFLEYLERKLKSLPYKIFITTILLLMALGLTFALAQYKQDSANGRLLIWKVANSGIKDTPLQGQGFNAFQASYGHFQAAYFQKHTDNQREIMIADNINAAFNDYVEITFNLGYIGLFLFIAFWLSLFKTARHVSSGAKYRDSLVLRNDLVYKHHERTSGDYYVLGVTILIIFLVSSGFYFVEKMLSVKVIVLFFAAYISSASKSIAIFYARPTWMKSFAVIILLFSCIIGYATIIKTKQYVQWNKADSLAQFGYVEEASKEYELLYPHMQHNGLFLYRYSRVLYTNEAYIKCLEFMEMAKDKITSSEFYGLLGDACFKTSDYENAIKNYEYAAYMVPNRFRPLYKLFKLYEEIGKTQQALNVAQIIVNKTIKINSNETQEIIKECRNFIHLKNVEYLK